jgi:hypothetical protein
MISLMPLAVLLFSMIAIFDGGDRIITFVQGKIIPHLAPDFADQLTNYLQTTSAPPPCGTASPTARACSPYFPHDGGTSDHIAFRTLSERDLADEIHPRISPTHRSLLGRSDPVALRALLQ